MYEDRIRGALIALGKISELISELSSRLNEYMPGACDIDFNAPALNKFKKEEEKSGKSGFVSSEKGDEELIKLKYGQGQIVKKVRIRKKDNSKYIIYEGRFRDEYGKVKSVYAKDPKECLKLLRAAHPARKSKPRQPSVTVKEWVLFWYENFKAGKIRATTCRTYESDINLYILPALGKYKLKDLTGEVLQAFFNGIEKGNTRKKIYVLLSACLEKAVRLRRIEFNPCKVVELPKYKAKKRRPFTYEEQNMILRDLPSEVAQVFFFMCVTGLRAGEFLALRKADFYFEEHFFKVDAAIAAGVKGDPKTEASNRIVYYTDELFDYFDLNILGKYKTYEGLRSAFSRMLSKYGIRGISLHCTRHTFATICHSLGMNDKTLQTLLGHSTLAMTQDIYTHLLRKGDSPVRNYLEKLCTTISTII